MPDEYEHIVGWAGFEDEDGTIVVVEGPDILTLAKHLPSFAVYRKAPAPIDGSGHSLMERHLEHYRGCNSLCLAYADECCVAGCECHGALMDTERDRTTSTMGGAG